MPLKNEQYESGLKWHFGFVPLVMDIKFNSMYYEATLNCWLMQSFNLSNLKAMRCKDYE
jgi:hypothetical protein